MRTRAECAWKWITTFSPEDVRFALRTPSDPPAEVTPEARAAIIELRALIADRWETLDEKTLGEAVYTACGNAGIEPKAFFVEIYRVLVGKERGPRLASFMLTVGRERILEILGAY
jgi:lysyl-tRNA synthetase class 1